MGDDVKRSTTDTAVGRGPIPTPMRLQWRRARYQAVPALVFTLSLAATGYLWKNHAAAPHGVGEVAAVTIRVAAPRDGRLVSTGGNYPQVYDHVTAHQPIAKLDVGHLVSEEEKAQEDLSRLQSDLDKATAQAETAAKSGADAAKIEELKRRAAALRDAIVPARSRLNDLTDRIRNATIQAPVSGKVTAVSRRPDEFVKQGEEILTITPDAGSYILSYVRPESAIVPKKNMKVVVRNQTRKKSAVTTVQEVGTRIEPVPDHQLVNSKKPEWGIPVRIALPDAGQLPLMPGELVVLNFQPADADPK